MNWSVPFVIICSFCFDFSDPVQPPVEKTMSAGISGFRSFPSVREAASQYRIGKHCGITSLVVTLVS